MLGNNFAAARAIGLWSNLRGSRQDARELGKMRSKPGSDPTLNRRRDRTHLLIGGTPEAA
jgi:hypothetical protein